MDGIIVIDKPQDITSHKVVSIIRKLFPGVKAGHTGTLDPMATGVLPICLGKATRVAEYVIELPKKYQAGIIFGKTSDTEDITGTIEIQENVPIPSNEEIAAIIDTFTGEVEQTPPYYSAVKYKGKPMYLWTRQGKKIPREKRKIQIYEIKIISFNQQREPHLTLEISCSKGTYIRTLAADIGKKAGCGAVLSELRRLEVGPFNVKDSITLLNLEAIKNTGEYGELVKPIDTALSQFPALKLSDMQIESLKDGRIILADSVEYNGLTSLEGPLRFYDYLDNFKGLVTTCINEGNIGLKTLKYLARDEAKKGEL